MATPHQMALATMPEPDIVAAQKQAGQITGTFVTADRNAGGFQTAIAPYLQLEHDGIAGSRHQGWTRPADVRAPYVSRGTPIRNTRALSIVSIEDLSEAADLLNIPKIDPRWIGANLIIEGIERVSFLPRGTHLMCEGGTILIVEDQNAPCRIAGGGIAAHYPDRPDLELEFPKLAKRLRGVVASVDHPGRIMPGCTVTARIPEQWLYR